MHEYIFIFSIFSVFYQTLKRSITVDSDKPSQSATTDRRSLHLRLTPTINRQKQATLRGMEWSWTCRSNCLAIVCQPGRWPRQWQFSITVVWSIVRSSSLGFLCSSWTFHIVLSLSTLFETRDVLSRLYLINCFCVSFFSYSIFVYYFFFIAAYAYWTENGLKQLCSGRGTIFFIFRL